MAELLTVHDPRGWQPCASTFSTAFVSISGAIIAPGSNHSATFIAPAVLAVSRSAILRLAIFAHRHFVIFSKCEAAHT